MTGGEELTPAADSILSEAVDWVGLAATSLDDERERLMLVAYAAQSWAILHTMLEVESSMPEVIRARLTRVQGDAPAIIAQIGGRVCDAGEVL